MNSNELYQLWDEFLESWPVQRVEAMTLEEYTKAGDPDSFMNWVEFRTKPLATISGTSSFIFGIYSRKDQTAKSNTKNNIYEDQYAWRVAYGRTKESAFQHVKTQILAVIKAIQNNDLHKIEEIDLIKTVKWKIAFLYQDRNNLKIIPTFAEQRLRYLTGVGLKDKDFTIEKAYQQLISEKGDQDLFDFNSALTQKYLEANPKDKFNTQIAYDYMHERYPEFEKNTEYLFVIENKYNYELALETTNFDKSSPRLFLKCIPPKYIKGLQVNSILKGKSPNSNLESTKTLTRDDEFVQVIVTNMQQLEALCNWWDELNESNQDSSEASKLEVSQMEEIAQPLNRILFGAAGTGKTFNTINHALSIIEDKSLEELEKEERKDLKNRFDEYKNKGQIKFVTFHQSFSYEDFVEGIRAETVEYSDGKKNIEYPVVSGVFKLLCDTAQSKVILESQKINFDSNTNEIWKMSLGRAGEDEDIFDYCIKNHCVLLGWGDELDFSNAVNRKQIEEIMDKNGYEAYRKEYPSASRFVNDFKNKTKVGDLIIISDGNHKFRAIGEINGNYELLTDSEDAPRYVQKKSVKWLKLFKPSLNVEQLFDKVLSQQTIYNLANSINISKLKNLLDSHQKEDNDKKFVLIIDEINRGNISRIFGELITLIEESKRQGAKEQLSVTLPYSKYELTVPNNLYLIGTMNSSDRSLTGLDIALRRRFTFIEMPPKPELLAKVTVDEVNIQKLLTVINQRIEILLDRDHCLGHANFMSLEQQPTLENLSNIFKQKVIPQLQEYFFDDWAKINLVLNGNGMLKPKPVDTSAIFPNVDSEEIGYFEDKKIWELVPNSFNSIESFKKIIQY